MKSFSINYACYPVYCFLIVDIFLLSVYFKGPARLCFPPRRVRREADRRQSSVASRRANMSDRIQLEQEVIHLKKEVAAVRREPADTQKVLK